MHVLYVELYRLLPEGSRMFIPRNEASLLKKVQNVQTKTGPLHSESVGGGNQLIFPSRPIATGIGAVTILIGFPLVLLPLLRAIRRRRGGNGETGILQKNTGKGQPKT
jgi:hypothetical protein